MFSSCVDTKILFTLFSIALFSTAFISDFPIPFPCVPLSTAIKDYAGCIRLIKDNFNNLKNDSEIITFQVRTISKERLLNKIGEITNEQLIEIKKSLLEVLTY